MQGLDKLNRQWVAVGCSHAAILTSMADTLAWSALDAADLDRQSLYDVLALRSAVFVVEQDCAYQDLDGLDLVDGTVHVLGKDGGSASERGTRVPLSEASRESSRVSVSAYARVLAPDDEHPTPRIGRVIVASEARGRQLARELMAQAIEVCEARWPGPIELGAQAHLTGFYGSLGFEPVGEPYDEDGIQHQWMRREPSR